MINIAATDLNLLVAFDAMMQERNVTRAGNRIGLAQPSMSNALARLRALMDDELFVRSPQAMVPTTLAFAIAPHVSAALQAADMAINHDRVLDPLALETDISLATTDAFDYIYLPQIIQRLSTEAPGVRILTRGYDRVSYEKMLDSQEVDLAIGVDPQPSKRIRSSGLYADRFVCIAREGHSVLDAPLDMEAFLAADHALFSMRGDGKGVVDEVLADMGFARRVTTSIANYTSLPSLIARTDHIGVVAERLALRAAEDLPIVCLPLPFAMKTFEMRLFWSMGADRNVVQKWFRDLLSDVISKTNAS